MTAKRSMNSEEVIKLLSKLKAETLDYPADLMAAKKAAFLKQAVNIKIDSKGQGGDGGQQGGSGGSGGTGPALGGGSSALWQSLIGIIVVTGIILTAYMYRDQISDLLAEREVAALAGSREDSEEPSQPVDPVVAPESVSPAELTLAVSPSEIEPTGTPVPPSSDDDEDIIIDGRPVVDEDVPVDDPDDEIKDNPGLHLGQTPGPPAAPGLGNPGNENQPDKPDKPDKPEKPEKPEKPPKK